MAFVGPTPLVGSDERFVPVAEKDLSLPTINLHAFLFGDPVAVYEVPRLVRYACERHGFFLVANHGVKPQLISEVHRCMGVFFSLPLFEKSRAQRRTGESNNYTSSFTDCFPLNLQCKETLSFHRATAFTTRVRDYLMGIMGEEFHHFEMVMAHYYKEMTRVSLEIMELLGVSLGVGREQFREFYESHDSIMRLNYYTSCQKPGLTHATVPHSDPTSLTIIHQDGVSGLQILTEGMWHTVRPSPDTFTVNIGDIFKAQSNGRYQSCLHRTVVNSAVDWRSMAFFLCPEMDKMVGAPNKLVSFYHPRVYPDFTWAELLEFTQKHNRDDVKTLDSFTDWILTKRGLGSVLD